MWGWRTSFLQLISSKDTSSQIEYWYWLILAFCSVGATSIWMWADQSLIETPSMIIFHLCLDGRENKVGQQQIVM
jgi:hypothetical protein